MRRALLIGGLLTALCLQGSLLAGGERRLEGKWTGWVMEGKGDRPSRRRAEILEMVVSRTTIQARDRQRSMGQGTYRVDPKPGHLDATSTEGRTRGSTHLGIYRFEGDALHWCVANPGRPRPTEFKTVTGAQFLMILTRVK